VGGFKTAGGRNGPAEGQMSSDPPKIVQPAVTVRAAREDLVKLFRFAMRSKPGAGEKLVENPKLLLVVRKRLARPIS